MILLKKGKNKYDIYYNYILKIKPFNGEDYKLIGTNFYSSAKKNGMTVQTCFEDINLTEYGFIKGECLS